MTRPIRMGILTRSSNSVLEPLTSAIAATLDGRVTAHFSRFRVTAISDDPASHHQFDLHLMLKAAELLADADVDVIVWDGTSGSWEGLNQDHKLVSAIDVPAASAADADFVLVDPTGTTDLADSHVATDYSPFAGIIARGRIRSTWPRGECLVRDGELVATSVAGRHLPVPEGAAK